MSEMSPMEQWEAALQKLRHRENRERQLEALRVAKELFHSGAFPEPELFMAHAFAANLPIIREMLEWERFHTAEPNYDMNIRRDAMENAGEMTNRNEWPD